MQVALAVSRDGGANHREMRLEITPRRAGGATALRLGTPSRAGVFRPTAQPRLTRSVPSATIHVTAPSQASGQRGARCLTASGVEGTRSPPGHPVSKLKANKPSTSIIHSTVLAADAPAAMSEGKELESEASRTQGR